MHVEGLAHHGSFPSFCNMGYKGIYCKSVPSHVQIRPPVTVQISPPLTLAFMTAGVGQDMHVEGLAHRGSLTSVN